MSAVPREIVYEEVEPGQMLTRKEIRLQRRAERSHKERQGDNWTRWGGILLLPALGMILALSNWIGSL